jgi:hypothetical protein
LDGCVGRAVRSWDGAPTRGDPRFPWNRPVNGGMDEVRVSRADCERTDAARSVAGNVVAPRPEARRGAFPAVSTHGV